MTEAIAVDVVVAEAMALDVVESVGEATWPWHVGVPNNNAHRSVQ